MKINVTGNEELPKIVCIHPLLGSSGGVLDILKNLKGEYCIIAPDMSAHGADTKDFISAKEEAETLANYLIDKGFTSIALAVGFSMGSLVVLNTLTDNRLDFGRVVLEGAPLYQYGAFMRKLVTFGYKLARKNAAAKPDEYIKDAKDRFGSEFAERYGEVTRKKFAEMSDTSIENAALTCSYFDFPPLPEELQKRIVFRYGSLEDNRKTGEKNIAKHYPKAETVITDGYRHCEYPFKNPDAYTKMLEELMTK
ncbi:MAG: alpha/beta hydrolase [Firmicutes bacterium]|nr:alpha/beta hydrolase [Bacillota bacterium]